MQVRFWGTRGSLPTATSGVSIREKIRRALQQAAGRRWESEEQLEAFIDDALAFPVRNGYGGDTSCVQIASGREPTLLDMGSGLRPDQNSICLFLQKNQWCRGPMKTGG